MTDKGKIAAIYGAVAVICAGIIAMVVFTQGANKRNREFAQNVGKALEDPVLTELTEPLQVTDQTGRTFDIRELEGKVWIFCQFYASCPECAKRNLKDLQGIYEKYRSNPDFRLVCMSVAPEKDGPEDLKSYAEGLGADSGTWLFLTGDPEELREYSLKQLKYPTAKKRTDPDEIALKGEYAHDLALSVFDRELQMRGKVDLFQIGDKESEAYQAARAAIDSRVERYLRAE